MEYKILEDWEVSSLNAQIEEHISEGWTPSGQVAVAGDGCSFVYVHAMKKE